MRHLAVALVVLCSATRAHAVPITGFAMGRVTENLSLIERFPPLPYQFTPGEAVFVQFTYDLDPPPTFPFPVRIAVHLFTEFGFRLDLMSSPSLITPSRGSEVGGNLRLELNTAGRSVDLFLGTAIGSPGRIIYTSETGRTEGFRADVVRVADSSGFPIPEPSTLAMGAIGVALAGLGWARRRAAA